MKKPVCVLAAACALCGIAFALGVDEPELRSTGSDGIEFENYGGPHAVIETAEAIVNIGTGLGQVVARAVEEPATVQPGGKYTLLHVVDSSTAEKLDADILLLNATAGVDHIRNLRRIITGYLEAAYGYERADAETIATFVTVYNAVYRGQLSYFAGKYKDAVLDNLTAEKVGLSTNWSEWAGNTQIVIPLNDPTGGISSVDTTTISDKQVIDALRQDEDKNVEARENMVDIKEREATAATAKAQDAQRTAVEQRAAAAAATTPAAAAAATARAENAAQTATTQQQLADRKNVEVQTERQAIAVDQNKPAPAVDTTSYLTGLFGADDQSGLYSLITVDGATGLMVRRSPVTQIRGKSVYIVNNVAIATDDGENKTFSELYVAVCGVNSGNSAVKLCLIDASSLEIQKQSAEILAEGTDLLRSADDFYVIIQEGSSCRVAQYDKNLTLLHRSEVNVKATSPINMTGMGLLVTDADGSPRLLRVSDLATIW